MRYLVLLSVVFFVSLACTDESTLIKLNTTSLRFSRDTIIFDTLFTNVGSITKRLKVYNDNDNAIEIQSIALGKSSNSPYTIYVKGQEGASFQNTRLLGNDSMLVLIKVIIDPMQEDLPFIVTDQINFETNGNLQNIKLVSWARMPTFSMILYLAVTLHGPLIAPILSTTPY